MLKKQVSPKIVAIVFAVIVVCFAIAVYVSAWTEPTTVPPGANVSAPLNVSTESQTKQGNLVVNALGINATGNALLVPNGNVGIGTTAPSYKLDVSGDINIPSTGFLRIGGNAGLSGQSLIRTATGMAWQLVSGGGGITSLSSGSGITLTPDPITSTGTIAVNTTSIQARVSGTCAVGSSIRAISSTGTVTCETGATKKSVLVMRAAAPAVAGACPAGWTGGGTGSAYYGQASQTNERYCYRADISCRMMTMRAVVPTVAGACPAGWTDGGTGSAYYGQSSQTNERYCFVCP